MNGESPCSEANATGQSELLGDLLPHSSFALCSGGEWMAILNDRTEIVVSDARDAPASAGVAKAKSILQNRPYFEGKALHLLEPLVAGAGTWRLLTIDFGNAARRVECEFLMCYAFERERDQLSVSSPYVEIGFKLMRTGLRSPMFGVLVASTSGLLSPGGRTTSEQESLRWTTGLQR